MIDLQALEVWNGFGFLLVLFIMYLLIILVCLTLSVLEKLKKLIFEIPIIPQTLKIYNLRSTSA